MVRRLVVLLGIVLAVVVAVTAALASPMREDHPPTAERIAPTAGQRSGMNTDGYDYERPRHLPDARRADDDRPNVVLITTDDQALSDMRWMPKTRRWLGRGGVTFRNMISPHPLCCPARAEILTGQFAQNNGVHTNAGPYGGAGALKDPDNTLAAWLQESGYLVGMSGKYLNQYDATQGVPNGWDYWNVSTTNQFGYLRYPMYGNGDPVFHGREYSSDVVRDDTVRLVEDWSETGQPFFIWASYYAPHGLCQDAAGCAKPPLPAPRHRTLYRGVESPSVRKPSFDEDDVRDKSHEIRKRDKVGRRAVTRLHRQRIRALAAVDQGVDQTFKALRRAGELDDTVVLFTSDNGYLLGEHRYRGKILPYEESIRVPLLARGPGFPKGATRRQTVTTVDLAPTILDLAEVEPGRVVDGRSMMPFVRDRDRRRRDTDILVQAGGRPDESPTPWWYRGVRNERWTFVRWSETGFLELYDNRKDRYQLENLAYDARHRPVVREMKRRLVALRDCSGAACRVDLGPPPRPRR
ncbi:sulfatase family protein [Nocardioides abyssi]|uniref:Sulfatase n=1 Tax=Nocardioides abyssi TaxID=3058370 RepID=A0ABT8EP28_9ACTN|nr:sulfatase [Nocardioides abyssi]MDN4159894.1 sulfatase [Nocardioides abyssi]